MSRRGEVGSLFEKSRRFYETALVMIEKGFYGLAAFNLERALKLHLKAAELGVGYPRARSASKDLFLKYSVELGALEEAHITPRLSPGTALEEKSRG